MPETLDKSKIYALLSSIILLGLVYAWFPFSKFLISAQAEPILKVAWEYSGGDDWAHCRIVPLFALLLVYLQWNEIRKIEWKGEFMGLPLLVFFGLIFWLGYITDLHYLAYLSFQGMIASLILWFAGKEMVRALTFPLLFLTFMWPWLFLDNVIAFPLRLFMSNISHHFLNLIGIPNLQIGSAIVSSPNFALGIPQGSRFQLDVANPCSGIRSLFALTMITSLYSYLTLPKIWQRWTLFVCSVPLAILGNFIRILLLTFATILFGTSFAIGTETNPSFFHLGAGYFVYIIAVGGMIGIGWLLQRDWKTWYENRKKEIVEETTPTPSIPSKETPAESDKY
ncbi:MAG: exosortase/archaeosortase family protein [Verrucomicrobiota bacterium]